VTPDALTSAVVTTEFFGFAWVPLEEEAQCSSVHSSRRFFFDIGGTQVSPISRELFVATTEDSAQLVTPAVSAHRALVCASRKFAESLPNIRFRKSRSVWPRTACSHAVEEDRCPGLYRRVDIAEVPFIGGDLAGRMQIRGHSARVLPSTRRPDSSPALGGLIHILTNTPSTGSERRRRFSIAGKIRRGAAPNQVR
jgi:hypothetical protein